MYRYVLYFFVEEAWQDILHGVSNRIPLSIFTQGQILLHFAQVTNTITKLSQATVHHVDMQGILNMYTEIGFK